MCAGCSSAEQIPPIPANRKSTPKIAELSKLYQDDKSQYSRQAICLRAIDEGVIQRGGPVSVIDEIFDTNYVSKLPSEKFANGYILFAPQPSVTRADGMAVGRVYVGWYIEFEYDSEGTIQTYSLANIHKGSSSVDEVNETVPIAELRLRYNNATSELERRTICWQAIDQGAIRTNQPVSSVDEIFGTNFASNLPRRKEATRIASIDFTPFAPGPHDPKAASHLSWFMALEYAYDGTIRNYYLSNLHK